MPTAPRTFPRTSGILLHPTSLPGPDGIGDVGPAARAFVDWLADHGQGLWQVLPLGPTSYGDSPYQSLGALAGNPLLISFADLVADGLLTNADLDARPDLPDDRVDFGAVIGWKTSRLDLAWARFRDGAAPADRADWHDWCRAQAAWLDDFALFVALKDEHGGAPWYEWDAPLRGRDGAALDAARARLADAVDRHRFVQWIFARQWARLRSHASERGVRLMGDVPIFVAHDSCDVWAAPENFLLDARGQPTAVAGVPPDYFSATGQLWGNPLYDWARLKADGYAWWVRRLTAVLDQVDLVRVDHFRGFEAYWEVPADAETAVGGRWVKGPGEDFFGAMAAALGDELPIVAEDLGTITPDVVRLREDLGLPGMKVLQYAWTAPDNAFLPHEHTPHAVVYTGTHDNDPTVGWWRHLADGPTRALVADYVGADVHEPHWTLIRLGMMSPAHTFIAPLQDVLGLGREARMNLPGEGAGNWNWRLAPGALDGPEGERLAHLTWLYRRRPDQTGAAVPEHGPAADTAAAEPKDRP
ncbi:4-alpha-glucanotransferase [bacterium]|nr:4-alpha-glucanotransferase [bacterium]